MAYADFDFYKNEYYGNLVSEDAFARLSAKASDKLDYLSNYRVPRYIDSIVTVTLRDEVLLKLIKKANCKLAEMMLDLENAETAERISVGYDETAMGMRGKTIQSISSGGESITYAKSSTNNAFMSVLGDTKAQNRLMYDGIREYLGGSGLLSQIM
jgi:hypothetical protein